MGIKIIGWIIAAFLILSILCVFAYVLLTCVYLARNKFSLKKRIIQKRKRKIMIGLLTFVLLLFVCVSLIKSLLAFAALSDTIAGENVNDEINLVNFLEIVEKIPFHDEALVEEQTIWEKLVCTDLLYGEYLEKSEGVTDFDELRKAYQGEFYEAQEIPFIEIDELIEQVKLFYGTEILPFTDKTLEDVEAEILPLEERLNTDVEVFQNEFWLRAGSCNADSSDECLYQAGRAADDVFKVLCNKADTGNKMKIFYSSMTVGFYLASIEYDTGNINIPLVYYRIAEIYIYLEEQLDFGENEEIKLHCLLMAEIFLMLAEKEYEKIEGGDIHKDLPFFSYYYAQILNKYIVKYNSKDKEVESKCYDYATQYINSPYSLKYPDCRNSCNDILDNLKDRGYVEIDSELE